MKRTAGVPSLPLVCLLPVLFLSLLLHAQDKVTFRVQPLHGQDTFHVGERIPLQLSFSAPVTNRFALNLAGYDRSGRMEYEQFAVTPKSGWSDPLARYFSALVGRAGGGLSMTEVLTTTPTTIPLNLNEWIRFDQPGTYHVAVTSRRVSDALKKHAFNDEGIEPLAAEPFTLHIVPANPAWQVARLQGALAQLDATPYAAGKRSAERDAAIADLRFLATEGSLEELAANLRDDRPDTLYQSAFGLMGVPDPLRDVALKQLTQELEAPLFPVSGWFIETMAILQASGDYTRATDETWRKVLAALPRKQGKAKAATVQTLLDNPPADLGPEWRAELADTLASSFPDLTEDQRAAALRWQWDLLRSASMLPALQASAKLPLSHPGSNESSAFSRLDLKAAALAHWYELDPAGALQEILAQIGSATPSLTAGALTFLPQQTLPQFEPVWAQELLKSSDEEKETVLGGLLVRFGTGAASALIAEKLRAEQGASACAPQAAALAYLVKFDPDGARPLLQQVMSPETQAKTGCHQTLFQDVSTYASGTVLTDAAVATLDKPNRRDAMDALIYLAAYGRAKDRQPILDRYAEWSQQWSGKADVLDLRDEASATRNYPEIGLGQNLARALIANQGWLADDKLIARVLAMCVSEQVCQQVRQLAASASPPYHVSALQDTRSANFQVGQYSAQSLELLQQKVAQYPKGSTFQLTRATPQNNDQKHLEDEVQEIFHKEGMSLETAPN